jgi:3-deoxy-D-manno-octulosonic-acid transferase
MLISLERVGGTTYNQYTITPLLNLGIPLHKVHQLATALNYHAKKAETRSQKQDTKYNSTTVIIGDVIGDLGVYCWRIT